MCTKILGSNSSWLYGVSWVLLSSKLFERSRLPLVMTSLLKPVSMTSFSACKWNSSVLLPSVSGKRGSLHYLYSFNLFPFWSCCRLNASLNVNIENHINECKTLLLEPMSNISRKVLQYSSKFFDSRGITASAALAVLWGGLVNGSTYLSNSLKIPDLVWKLTIYWQCSRLCVVFVEEKNVVSHLHGFEKLHISSKQMPILFQWCGSLHNLWRNNFVDTSVRW